MSASPAVLERIPHRPPFLFVDEIVSETADSLVARRTLRADEDFYRGHYPSAPITPGVLLCEAVFQTGALYLAGPMSAGGPRGGLPLVAKMTDVRFRNPVFPGDTLLIEVKKKESMAGFTMMSGSITSGEKRVMSIEFAVLWKAPDAAPVA